MSNSEVESISRGLERYNQICNEIFQHDDIPIIYVDQKVTKKRPQRKLFSRKSKETLYHSTPIKREKLNVDSVEDITESSFQTSRSNEKKLRKSAMMSLPNNGDNYLPRSDLESKIRSGGLEVSVLKRENKSLREENEILKNKNKEFVEEEKKLKLEIMSLKFRLKEYQKEKVKEQIFSEKTKLIEKEFSEAFNDMEKMKKEIKLKEEETKRLLQKEEEQDEELKRVNKINKNLQQTVDRLLLDLQQAQKPNPNKTTSKISQIVLRQLDQLLSSPSKKLNQKLSIRTIYRDNDVIQSHDVTDTTDDETFVPLQPSSEINYLSDVITPSSSMITVTSQEEKHFNENLASLDSNIERLEESLKMKSMS